MILNILFVMFAIKLILFWIFILQLKEYRADRFWAEYGSIGTIVKFWIFGGGRKFSMPVWTLKAALIFLVSSSSVGAALFAAHGVPAAIAVYFCAPGLVIGVVFLLGIPTHLVRRHMRRRAARKIAGASGLMVIGITGSYGKSSTKEFLSQLLSKKFRVAKTHGNINTEIGISRYIIKNLKPDDEVFIVEMGAYKPGEIKKICEMVKPKMGILTGISEQHEALFGSFEALKKAKYELIDALPADGVALFNGENRHCIELSKNWKGNKVMYRNTHNRCPDLPTHYGLNLSGAVEAAKYLGMTEWEIAEAVGGIRLGERMIHSFAGKNGALVIDDTYSANPDGVFAALEFLSLQPQKNKVIVMPCLIELGSTSAAIHKKIGALIDKNCDLAIVTTPACFEAIASTAGDKAVLETSPKKLLRLLDSKMNAETAILLEGRVPEIIMQSLR